jgi:peroxiredoxin
MGKSKKKTSVVSMTGRKVPRVKLRTRIRDPKIAKNPYKWKTIKSNNLFKNKKVVLFSLPGAFTPTCSSNHLPGYERKYNNLRKLGVDDVICMSVNDSFVMKNWGDKLKIKKVLLIPDGNGEFTRRMGALVPKNNLGFGERSWRYSMLVDNGKIVKVFEEPGRKPNCKTDPFKKSNVDTMIKYLRQQAPR